MHLMLGLFRTVSVMPVLISLYSSHELVCDYIVLFVAICSSEIYQKLTFLLNVKGYLFSVPCFISR